ncbi:uncharacterized protein LOC132742499 [Ruditapes philippinarum]|uniref:uncharacterized protein LOC132742499 n=1 Tax=Ruditapes philippinarum TaxID=129788 RepID=UPI00295A64F1|nr:uncharacterized protein LOC132742499 [Ruditapes philippinarum]
MWKDNKQATFVLFILSGHFDLFLGCISPSYNANKAIAHCSDTEVCPPDTSHCHQEHPNRRYGTCCLGCGIGVPEPKRSCMKRSDCKSKDRSKRYRCTKPGHNVKARGVCCENIRGY